MARLAQQLSMIFMGEVVAQQANRREVQLSLLD